MALALLGFAGAKILGGPEPGSLLAQSHLHWPVAVLELLLGAAFVGKHWRLAAWGSSILFVAGIAAGVFWSERPCGCYGHAVNVSRALHLAVAATGGLLSSTILLGQASPRPRLA